MPTEFVEYRPGKWVKVIDGRIVGRATAEEVAAWQAQAGRSARSLSTATPLVLDVDLSPRPPRQAEPAQALDVSVRPAFERRGRAVSPAGPAPQPPPTSDAARPARRRLEMTAPAGAPAPPRERPAEPAPDETRTPAFVRRERKPKERAERPAPAQAASQPPVEVTPLPKPEAARRRPAPAGSESAAAEPPAAEETADAATPAPGQGPAYWWVWNAHQQPVDAFLREWAARYRDKFGRAATAVLCHEADLAAARAAGFDADPSPLLQPGHFYLSHGDAETPSPAKKRGGA